MALDTDMKALLDQMVAAKVQSFHQMTPQAAREQMARRTSDREGKYAWRQLAQRWQRCAELRQPGGMSRGAAQGAAQVVPLKRKASSRRPREATAA